jgi:hypothetical protein
MARHYRNYPNSALPKFIHFADVRRFGCGIVLFNVHNETHPLVGEPRIGRASNASGPDFDSYFLIPYAFRKHQSRAGLLRQA